MKSIRCLLGVHKGNVKPAHEISEEIEGRSAFVCRRCGEIK